MDDLDSTERIVGLMKTVLSLYLMGVRAQLHLRQLNPQVNRSDLQIVIPTELQSWPVG
jgi:acyl transferase domain-containing protein